MAGVAPLEIIAAPFDIWLAPVGTAFTDIGATPSGAWTLLGTSGNKNYTEDGVKVKHGQNIQTFTPVGLTAPRKAFRTSETLTVVFTLVDVSAAQYAKVLNNPSVTTTANGGGLAGSLNIPLLQGMTVNTYALLARGLESPAGATFVSQYQIPICFQNAEPEIAYKKGDPGALDCEFMALWDSTLGFGKYLTQNAVVA